MRVKLLLSMLVGLLLCTSCARFAEVDKSMINHPAMDLASDMTEPSSNAFTTLNGGAGPAAGCAT